MAGSGEWTLGDVIFVQFGDGPKISRGQYEAAIERLERVARDEPPETARPLRRLAKAYRKRAQI